MPINQAQRKRLFLTFIFLHVKFEPLDNVHITESSLSQ